MVHPWSSTTAWTSPISMHSASGTVMCRSSMRGRFAVSDSGYAHFLWIFALFNYWQMNIILKGKYFPRYQIKTYLFLLLLLLVVIRRGLFLLATRFRLRLVSILSKWYKKVQNFSSVLQKFDE